MKKIVLATAFALFAGSLAHASGTLKIEGLYDSNAGTVMESLLSQASKDKSIVVDTSTYTITKVTREDKNSRIECSRSWFGGTPAQYTCIVADK